MKKNRTLMSCAFAFLLATLVACTAMAEVPFLTAAITLAAQTVEVSDSITLDVETAPPTSTPVPEALPSDSPVLSIAELYLSPSSRKANGGDSLTAELVLKISNADGTALAPFGIQLNTAELAQFSVQTVLDGVNASYGNGILWVTNATAVNGRATLNGEPLSFKMEFTPFAPDSTAERVTLSWQLLDAAGAPVALVPSEESGAIVRERLRISRGDIEAAEPSPSPEATVTVPVETIPVQTEEPTPEPTASLLPQITPVPHQLRLHASIAPEFARVGDVLEFTAELIGYENETVAIRWQQRKNDVWENIADETTNTLKVLITEENFHDAWRFEVTVLDQDTAAALLQEQPAAEQPAAEQPAAEQPAAEQPAAEQPAAEQPAADQPISVE
ncbi:MAG: hypothetical protein RR696_01675 [Clostridia bacterium]